VALIQVGASTEPEMKQRKQLFEGSLAATRSALEEGTVTGGGIALLRAVAAIEKLKLEGDELIGAQLVARALREPARKIITNCGVDASVMLQGIEQAKGSMGFNGATGQVEDLVQAGIIDPAKTVKAALTHAASIAGMVLLSEALIGDADDELEETA
jgi:chaperonin GroEL